MARNLVSFPHSSQKNRAVGKGWEKLMFAPRVRGDTHSRKGGWDDSQGVGAVTGCGANCRLALGREIEKLVGPSLELRKRTSRISDQIM